MVTLDENSLPFGIPATLTMTAEAALFVRDQVSEKLPSERVRIVHEACRRCMEEGESVVTIDHVKAALDA